MLSHDRPGLAHPLIHERDARLDKPPPEPRAEEKRGFATPILGEVEPVNPDGKLLVDDRQVPLVEDAIEQRLHECGSLDHVHEDLVHPADAPGALEQAHAELAEDEQVAPVSIGQAPGPSRSARRGADRASCSRRERVPGQRRLHRKAGRLPDAGGCHGDPTRSRTRPCAGGPLARRPLCEPARHSASALPSRRPLPRDRS